MPHTPRGPNLRALLTFGQSTALAQAPAESCGLSASPVNAERSEESLESPSTWWPEVTTVCWGGFSSPPAAPTMTAMSDWYFPRLRIYLTPLDLRIVPRPRGPRV